MNNLHQRLIDRQSIHELSRKQIKARTKHYWTQEDCDLADREAEILHKALFEDSDVNKQ